MTPSPQPPAQLTVVERSKRHTRIHAVPSMRNFACKCTNAPTQMKRQPADPNYVNTTSVRRPVHLLAVCGKPFFFLYPSFHEPLIHIWKRLCRAYLHILEAVHDGLDGCNLALSVPLRSAWVHPSDFREKLNYTAGTEKEAGCN